MRSSGAACENKQAMKSSGISGAALRRSRPAAAISASSARCSSKAESSATMSFPWSCATGRSMLTPCLATTIWCWRQLAGEPCGSRLRGKRNSKPHHVDSRRFCSVVKNDRIGAHIVSRFRSSQALSVRSDLPRIYGPVSKRTTNVPKKRPVPTKRSQPVVGAKATASSSRPPLDDVEITALALPAGKLSPEMAAYFRKCDEKLGFVPNVLKAFAFEDSKLQAFVDYRQELVQNAANLSKLEIEMIATVVSSQNRCFYCITAHGNAVRQLGDPLLGEMMVMNYRAARLPKRQRAMLDFAVKLTTQPWEVEEEDRDKLRRAGFTDRDIWDIASVAAFYNMTNRLASATDMRPNSIYHGHAR